MTSKSRHRLFGLVTIAVWLIVFEVVLQSYYYFTSGGFLFTRGRHYEPLYGVHRSGG